MSFRIEHTNQMIFFFWGGDQFANMDTLDKNVVADVKTRAMVVTVQMVFVILDVFQDGMENRVENVSFTSHL